jgi:tetratricopeptide (TPR) repeat protein
MAAGRSLWLTSALAWAAVALLTLTFSPQLQAETVSTGEEEPAGAPGRAERLDQLFAELKAAKSIGESRHIEARIWAAWLDSGDAEIDRMMSQAIAAMSGGDFVEAIAHLDRIIESKPDYAEGWNKRATVYFLINDYERSLEDVARTLELEPRHFGALSGLGMIMVRLGDKRQALEAFKRALEVDPNLAGAKEAVERLEAELSKDI